MRICILGAGATGGHFAYRLALAGQDVSVVARGAHLAAIRDSGLGFVGGEETGFVTVAASDDPADLGAQDVVIVGVKATGLAAVAPLLRPLVAPHTLVLFPQNGMPWWYPVGEDLPHPLPDLPVFRHGKQFLQFLEPAQIAGGTIYSGNEVREPGIVFNSSPGKNFISFSELVPEGAAAADRLLDAFADTGVVASRPPNLRASMWRKLLQNMSGSAIALATRNRSSISRQDPRLGEIYARIVTEGNAIAASWGYPVDIDPAEVLAKIPHHRPSLLQDYEQGRPMEIGEIVLAPAAFARAADVASPSLDAVAAIVARLAIDKELYADA
jgi:2-dehydropantoate 2-reductase